LLQSQKAAADNTVIGEATKLKGRIEAHWSKMVEKELAFLFMVCFLSRIMVTVAAVGFSGVVTLFL